MFTMDRHAVERTIITTDRAIAALTLSAMTPQARVRAVMENVRLLCGIAAAKAESLTMPELVVIDADDLRRDKGRRDAAGDKPGIDVPPPAAG